MKKDQYLKLDACMPATDGSISDQIKRPLDHRNGHRTSGYPWGITVTPTIEEKRTLSLREERGDLDGSLVRCRGEQFASGQKLTGTGSETHRDLDRNSPRLGQKPTGTLLAIQNRVANSQNAG